MPNLQEEIYDLIERALFLPMAITIFNRDLAGIEESTLKLKHPYKQLISESLKIAQKDLMEVRKELRKRKLQSARRNAMKPLRSIHLSSTVMKKTTAILIRESVSRSANY